MKGPRFNLPMDKPTATAILQIQPRPVGLYVVPPPPMVRTRKRWAN
ncbi:MULTISPECIES: hypothetical protein [Mesorhizobium]|nr:MULTISPECIES: hypothetical protein [Mesorhizobium]